MTMSNTPAAPVETALQVVQEQAEDHGLWFVAETATESYLQQALRRLHAAVESHDPSPTGGDTGLPENVRWAVDDARRNQGLAGLLEPLYSAIVYLADQVEALNTAKFYSDMKYIEQIEALQDQVLGLQLQLDKAAADSKDAQRYRHLREHADLCLTGDDHGWGPEVHEGGTLDAVIDTAMSQSPEESDA